MPTDLHQSVAASSFPEHSGSSLTSAQNVVRMSAMRSALVDSVREDRMATHGTKDLSQQEQASLQDSRDHDRQGQSPVVPRPGDGGQYVGSWRRDDRRMR